MFSVCIISKAQKAQILGGSVQRIAVSHGRHFSYQSPDSGDSGDKSGKPTGASQEGKIQKERPQRNINVGLQSRPSLRQPNKQSQFRQQLSMAAVGVGKKYGERGMSIAEELRQNYMRMQKAREDVTVQANAKDKRQIFHKPMSISVQLRQEQRLKSMQKSQDTSQSKQKSISKQLLEQSKQRPLGAVEKFEDPKMSWSNKLRSEMESQKFAPPVSQRQPSPNRDSHLPPDTMSISAKLMQERRQLSGHTKKHQESEPQEPKPLSISEQLLTKNRLHRLQTMPGNSATSRRSGKHSEMYESLYDSRSVSSIPWIELQKPPVTVELKTWDMLHNAALQETISIAPQNMFEEMIQWTKEGKLWKFPIDNEQGLEAEQNVHFSEHVFLDKHLKDWCPRMGPVRHFMELVCNGLSKNPYMTVEEKVEHIMWYKNYFAEKQSLLEDTPASSEQQQITA